jgi:4-hydroxybenzoate polyprenyltransferase
LLIIALTMYLLRYFVVQPLLEFYGFELQLSHLHFFLLVFSTMLLSAAGYIINDYYDKDADAINKPDKVIIGKNVSPEKAMNIYTVMNIIAIGIGIYISFIIQIKVVSIAFVMVAGLLWFYTTSYKGQFILGNLMVAIFAGIVPLMVFLFEVPVLNMVYKNELIARQMDFNYLFGWIAFYSLFAFIITFIREIIKDAEDFEGDKAYGQRTLPVVLGLKVTKVVLSSLLVITIAFILYLYFTYIPDVLTLLYLVLLIITPLLFVLYKIYKANNSKQYHLASNICKIVMLFGILYSLLVKYLILKM